MTESATPSSPTTGKSRPGRLAGYAAAGRRLAPACRFALGLFGLNGLCGLAAVLPAKAGLAELFRRLIEGDARTFLLQPHSPAAAVRALAAVAPLTLVVVGLGAALFVLAAARLHLSALAALLLACALLVVTLRASGSDLWGDLRGARVSLLLLAVLLFGVVLTITTHRWGILLAVQGVSLDFRLRARLTMIGMFFNIAIPGAVGGDLIKMAYVARAAGEKRKTEAIFTILVDRIVGLLALFLVAAISVLVALPSLLELQDEYAPVRAASLFIAGAGAAAVAGVLLIEFRSRILGLKPVAAVVRRGRGLLPHGVAVQLDRVIYALDLYRENRGAIVRALAWSLLVHSLLSVTLFTIGRAVGEQGVGLRQYFLTTQVANTVGAIPATPGGVGTRDAVTAVFLSAFGARPAEKIGSIPVIMTLVILFWGLVGAVVFIASPAARHAARSAPVAAAEEAPQAPGEEAVSS